MELNKSKKLGFEVGDLKNLDKEGQIKAIKLNLDTDRLRLTKDMFNGLDKDVRYLILDKCAKTRPLYTASMIECFNIQDEDKKCEIAKKIIKSDIEALAYVDKFGIQDEDMRTKLFKDILKHTRPMYLLRDIKKFGITNQDILYDFANMCLDTKEQSGVLASYFNELGIQDEGRRIHIAHEVAKINGGILPICVECFEINNEAELMNIARELIPKHGNELADNIERFGILSHSNKLELARLLAEDNGEELTKNLELFEIDDGNELINLAKKIAKKDGGVVADNIEKFKIQDEKSKVLIATIIAKQIDGDISKNIKKFKIQDESKRIQIAKIAANVNGISVVKHINEYEITSKDVLFNIAKDIAVLDDSARLGSDIRDYGINTIKDINYIFSIMLSHDNLNVYKLKTISNYQQELKRVYAQMPSEKILPIWFLRMIRRLNPSRIDNAILCKTTMNNVEQITNFYKDKLMNKVTINLNVKAVLGKDNEKKINEALNGISNDRDVQLAKEIIEKIMFAQITKSVDIQHKDELTKLIIELITIKKLDLKNYIMPHVIKYINDDKLSDLAKEIGQNDKKKAYPAINAVLFDMLSIYDNKALLDKVRKLFYSNNFIKDSKSLQDVYMAIIDLCETYLTTEKKKDIVANLIQNPKKLKENIKYISSIISFNEIDNLEEVQADSKDGAIRQTFYKIYNDYLNISDDKKFVTAYETFVNKDENKKRNLEELIMKYVAQNNKFTDVMRATRKFMENMDNINKFRDARYDITKSEHLKKISEINKDAFDRWSKEQQEFDEMTKQDIVKITDDPVDLFLIGTEVDGSCQSIEHGGELNKCLMGYVVDGKSKAIVIKNESGKIIARSIIRLFIEQNTNKVIMLKERTYKSRVCDDTVIKQLDDKCVEYAKWLGVSLVRENMGGHNQSEKFKGTLISKRGMAPYEYVDSANKYYNGIPYEISNNMLVYLHKQ